MEIQFVFIVNFRSLKMKLKGYLISTLLTLFNIGFPGQIREFTIQIHLLCIQIRQTWSGYEIYHSNFLFFHSI